MTEVIPEIPGPTDVLVTPGTPVIVVDDGSPEVTQVETVTVQVIEVTAPATPGVVQIATAPTGARGLPGEPGPAGPPGAAGPQGPPGDQHVFVQQTQPVTSGAYVWFELNPEGTLRTLWVEDGAA